MQKYAVSALATLVLGFTGSASAAPSVYSRASALDLGSVHSFGPDTTITVTVALKLNHAAELDGLIKSTYSAGSPNFRHFLTPQQFAQRFGPESAAVERVTRHLQAAGFTVTAKSPSHLSVSGRMSAFEHEFGVSLHAFEIPATADAPAFRFREPSAAPQLASAIADDVEAVVGLDNRPRLRPMNRHMSAVARARAAQPATSAPDTPNPPGEWTVQDLAKYYDVLPLYNQGISGRKRTIGIVTLASFTPSDAFAYWASLGLKVDPARITIVNVDGGPGKPSDRSGSDETTLDVEQSGGLAPAARIIVYQAPNTDQSFVDAFETAISSNTADAISCSWASGKNSWSRVRRLRIRTRRAICVPCITCSSRRPCRDRACPQPRAMPARMTMTILPMSTTSCRSITPPQIPTCWLPGVRHYPDLRISP